MYGANVVVKDGGLSSQHRKGDAWLVSLALVV